MTKEIELCACPFCGGKAKITTKRRGNYRREGDNFQGLCNGCKARGPLVQDSPEKAAEAWNRRAVQIAAAAAEDVQWWLAELDQYGNAKLVDGQHSDRAGADRAMYLFNGLGLAKGGRYAVARVELSEPRPSAEGVNLDAVAQCNKARAAVEKRNG